jgi:FkbM family methyltransferase
MKMLSYGLWKGFLDMVSVIKTARSMLRNRSEGGAIFGLNKAFNDKHFFDAFIIKPDDDAQTVFWKNAFRDFYITEKRRYAFFRVFPRRTLFKPFLDVYEKSIGADHTDEAIKLRELCLPSYRTDSEKVIISYILLDTFAQYLLDLDVNEDYPLMAALPEGPYERKNVRVESSDVVVDAGASIGDFTVLAAHKGAKVYAFEPSETIIGKYLKTTIDLNEKLSDDIIIAPYALSDTVGEAEFMVSNSSFSESKLQDKTGIQVADTADNKGERTPDSDATVTEKVSVTTLDSYVHENNLERVDFIKADIEGAERLMLKGARGVLRDFGPKLAICTYHLPDDPEVLEGLVRDANPKYTIEHRYKKMYAHIPRGA